MIKILQDNFRFIVILLVVALLIYLDIVTTNKLVEWLDLAINRVT